MIRPSLLFFLCALAPVLSTAQTTYQHLRPDFFNSGGDLQIIHPDKVRMISAATNDIKLRAQMFQATFTLAGEKVGNSPLDSLLGELARSFATLPLADGSVVVFAHLDGCDFFIPPQLAYFSAGGNVIWHASINQEMYYETPRLSLIQDSIIALKSDDFIQHFDMSGNPVGAAGQPFDLQLSLPSGFLVVLDSTLQRLNASFGIEHTITFSVRIVGIDTISEGGMVVLADEVYVLDDNLGIVDQTDLPGAYDHVISAGNGVWLFGQDGNILHLNNNLEAPEAYQLPFAGTIRDVTHVGDVIFIAGVEDPAWGSGLFFIRTEATAFLDSAVPDIGIVDIQFADFSHWHPAPDSICNQINYASCEVTLMNAGQMPIHIVDLNFVGGFCRCDVAYHVTWSFEGLALAPGSTTVVTLPEFVLPSSYSLPAEFCLTADGPNASPDKNAANDTYCVDIDLVGATRDIPSGHQGMTIIPNPASTEVTVAMGHERDDSVLSVINAQGQSIHEQILYQQTTRISIDHLAEGMYFFIMRKSAELPVISKLMIIR